MPAIFRGKRFVNNVRGSGDANGDFDQKFKILRKSNYNNK